MTVPLWQKRAVFQVAHCSEIYMAVKLCPLVVCLVTVLVIASFQFHVTCKLKPS